LEKGGLALVEGPKYLIQRRRSWKKAKADPQLIAAIGGLHRRGLRVLAERCAEGRAMVLTSSHLRSTLRELDPKVAKKMAKRRQSVRELTTLHTWRFRNWLRNKWVGGNDPFSVAAAPVGLLR
jgi:hypothetical protein